ncbi:MAG: DUF58 domain-containing protein [Chloroflexi bacterium]|nr:DUF58 domain-containing protein [Chloroflexota bacterium]
MNRLLFLGLLIYLIALMGLASLNGGILALTIPLLLFVGASLLYGPEQPDISISRQLSTDRAKENALVQVTVTVKNEGGRLELAHIKDAPPRKLALIEGETDLLTTLNPGQTVTLEYTLQGQRGRYEFGNVHIRTADYFRLFKRDFSLEADSEASMVDLFIYPEVYRIQRIPIRPRQTKAYAGPIPARIGGTGTDFFGVRHYQPGDSLRHINWRANARHAGTFFTNEYEQERVADVGIILDARQRSNIQLGDESLFEHTIQAAATLASSFLGDGNRVALLRYGDFLDWTVPGYGRIQQERILQSLARAQTGDSLVFDQLENLPARLFPAKSQLVLVSPMVMDDAPFLPRLLARGYSLLVVSPNPVSFEAGLLQKNELVDTAVRIARIERALLINKLRQAGIQVFDWDVRIPFDRALGANMAYMRPVVHSSISIVR